MKTFLSFLVGIFLLTSTVSAHEMFWYDRDSEFGKFAKIVIFPLSNAWDPPDEYQLGGEGTRNFRLNSYVDDRLTKKLKKVNFIRLANEIQEKSDIMNSLYGELLNPFTDEKERAAAVEEATMADMYLVPQFRENRIQEDISPRREWNVALKSWVEERGGPNGDRVYGERNYTVHHVIPEKIVYLHIMQVEFNGYDKDANQILTSLQQDRSYGVSEEGQFKDLVKDFQKTFLDARKDKKSKPKGSAKIGFTSTTIKGDYSDDIYFINAFDYALQESASKRVKNAVLIKDSSSTPDYHLQSMVDNCKLIPVWHDPSYSVVNKVVKTEESKWRDKDGNEHKMTTTYYDQEIRDIYAYWSFYWQMNTNFWLLNSQNDVLLSESYRSNDDKPSDAYRHAAEDFCKKVNKYFKEK